MRQFILQSEIPKNNSIILKEKDFRYLRQVLRSKIGDTINVRTKEGVLRDATVSKIDDKARTVTLQICDENFSKPNAEKNNLNEKNSAEFFLFQFLPRPQKFEQIVRQATECGVNTIIPILGEYSEKSSASVLENSKKSRIEKIIKEARQQSGSPVQTNVIPAVNLEKACEFWRENLKNLQKNQKSLAIALSERDDCESSLLKIVRNAEKKDSENENFGAETKSQDDSRAQNEQKIKKVALAVGSEGGISSREIEILQKNGFAPIHFNVNVLRCETAALYGIAATQALIL